MKEIICGKEVEVARKNNKNIIIKIDGCGNIRMTVPYRSSMEKARKFFALKSDWIEARLKKAVLNEPINIDSGEIIYIFGEGKRIVLTDESISAEIYGKDLIISSYGDREKTLRKILVDKLSAEASKYFDMWQERTGLKATSVSIRRTETRWGSCNHYTHRINLSLYLVNLPKECLSYVVLHELGHILYDNHGKEFKAFLDKNMQNWREVRKFMKENGERYKIKIKN